MDLLTKRQQYMQSLEQIGKAMQQLEQQFSELQVQKERTIGAVVVLDELIKSENLEQTDTEHPEK